MKRISFIVAPTLMFSIVLLIALAIVPAQKDTAYAAKENPIYQKLNDELIALYETDIAGEKIVSDMPGKDLEKLANKHGFTLKKTKALIILSDLSFRVNEPTPFNTLAQMKDVEIIRLGKHLFDLYGKTLSDEQKKELKDKALSALKSN